MPVRTIKGHLRSKDMPASLRAILKTPRSFSDVHHRFIAKAASEAQGGGDYDIPNEPPAFDQLEIGACVLNATVGAAQIVLANEGLTLPMLSRLFPYWLCRKEMGTLNEDSGTYGELAIDRIARIGICAETLWPYSEANFLDTNGQAVNPDPTCFPAASDNRPTDWFLVDTPDVSKKLDQLEAAIRSKHPFIFGTPVDSAIQRYNAGDVLTRPNQNRIIGGHEMVGTGVRYLDGQRVWRVRNSWGTDYGDDGHLLVDDSWMGWEQLDECYVLTRMDPILL